MTARKVSMTDVAREAGVSPATVDRVLNRRGGVRGDKEERVMAAARALGIDRALVDHTPSRTLRIAVLIQSSINPFHAALREGIELASRMYSSLNLQFFIHHINPRQPAAIAQAIRDAESYNGIIVSCTDDERVREAVASLSSRIPVVTVATDLGECGRAAYVGSDDRQGGRVAGDLMGLFLGSAGGQVMIVAGSLNIAGHRQREEGFKEILARRYPNCAVSVILDTGEDPDMAGRVVEKAFRQNPDLKGIYHMSAGALPTVQALQRLGRVEDTIVITHELTPDRRQLLKERKLSAVIDQRPLLEARLAVETMAKLLGRLPGEPATIFTDIQIFLSENA